MYFIRLYDIVFISFYCFSSVTCENRHQSSLEVCRSPITTRFKRKQKSGTAYTDGVDRRSIENVAASEALPVKRALRSDKRK